MSSMCPSTRKLRGKGLMWEMNRRTAGVSFRWIFDNKASAQNIYQDRHTNSPGQRWSRDVWKLYLRAGRWWEYMQPDRTVCFGNARPHGSERKLEFCTLKARHRLRASGASSIQEQRWAAVGQKCGSRASRTCASAAAR